MARSSAKPRLGDSGQSSAEPIRMQPSPDRQYVLPRQAEALLRVVQNRDTEIVFLKLMVDKLALQLLRARRAQYGRSSKQLDDPQIAPPKSNHCMSVRHPRQCQSPKPRTAQASIRGFQRICRATTTFIIPTPPMQRTTRRLTTVAAPRASGACARSAPPCPSYSNTCWPASRSLAICGLSWRACAARHFQAAALSRPIARDVAGQGQPPYARRHERQARVGLLLEKLHLWPTCIEGRV